MIETNRTASSLFLTSDLVLWGVHARTNVERETRAAPPLSRAWSFLCLTKERYEKINHKTHDTYHANAKEQRAYHPHANRISLFKVLKKNC